MVLKQPLLISYSQKVNELEPLVWWKNAWRYLKILAELVAPFYSLRRRPSSLSWLHASFMNFLFSKDFIATGRVRRYY